MNYEMLENELGYSFKNIKLLEQALTHTSYAFEHKVQSNEKLEFLGDAILEFVVSNYLFETYSKLKEGEMTKVRAIVVCEQSLYKIALKHNFSDFLKLGRSEIASNGAKRPAILADSVEAVIAAMYIDSSLVNVEKFIISNLEEAIEEAVNGAGIKDYKSELQEKLQKNGNVHIEYVTIKEEGPDHCKIFTVELKVNGKTLNYGVGKSKKQAEMEAARKTLEQ